MQDRGVWYEEAASDLVTFNTCTHKTAFLSEAIYGDDLDIFSSKPSIKIPRIYLLYTSLSSKAFYILHFSHLQFFIQVTWFGEIHCQDSVSS